jgi:hypothetical protein
MIYSVLNLPNIIIVYFVCIANGVELLSTLVHVVDDARGATFTKYYSITRDRVDAIR